MNRKFPETFMPIQALVHKVDSILEFDTPERCSILEAWNDESDPAISIARARVAPGITTQLHRLRAIDERYLVVAGNGFVRIGSLTPQRLGLGDIAIIPAGVAQQISNAGETDLIFYCICTPRFSPDCYEALE